MSLPYRVPCEIPVSSVWQQFAGEKTTKPVLVNCPVIHVAAYYILDLHSALCARPNPPGS